MQSIKNLDILRLISELSLIDYVSAAFTKLRAYVRYRFLEKGY